MEEESDTRKINNSFLRDHNYATEAADESRAPPMVLCAKANALGPHFRTPALKRLSPPYPQVPSIHYSLRNTQNAEPRLGTQRKKDNQTGQTLTVFLFLQSKSQPQRRGEYNVYSTFQSHEPEFDYLKSLEIEEKINKIKWLPQQNAAYFLLSTNGKSVC
ncbi:hypothetical protein FQN60_010478 [Etheostoma spectabile]|uniref:Uncharacterized protein n=1 Tax=Etheostoma spectabile TaxID=54343 RepID=A0A5J5D7X4_9PERO|nr:hypothetical protein FQN60_010478 [Etheostoma spectabile]